MYLKLSFYEKSCPTKAKRLYRVKISFLLHRLVFCRVRGISLCSSCVEGPSCTVCREQSVFISWDLSEPSLLGSHQPPDVSPAAQRNVIICSNFKPFSESSSEILASLRIIRGTCLTAAQDILIHKSRGNALSLCCKQDSEAQLCREFLGHSLGSSLTSCEQFSRAKILSYSPLCISST